MSYSKYFTSFQITAVCDFLNYLRYIERGLVKSSGTYFIINKASEPCLVCYQNFMIGRYPLLSVWEISLKFFTSFELLCPVGVKLFHADCQIGWNWYLLSIVLWMHLKTVLRYNFRAELSMWRCMRTQISRFMYNGEKGVWPFVWAFKSVLYLLQLSILL